MNIKEIINKIIIDELSLEQSLMILRTLTSDENIIKFINNELNGYSNDDMIPDYRILHGSIKGNFIDGIQSYSNICKAKNQNIPIDYLNLNNLEENSIYVYKESIKSLEYICNTEENPTVPLAIVSTIDKNILKLGRLQINGLWLEIPVLKIEDCISKLKNIIFNIFLDIKDLVDENKDILDYNKEETKTIINIINLKITGDIIGNDKVSKT